MELIQALLMHKPFAEEHIDFLHMIKDKFIQCRFNRGDTIIREGELVNCIGILCEGSATAFHRQIPENIYELKVTDFYGVPCLLNMQVSDFSIVCKLTAVSYILKEDEFFKIIGRFPNIRAYFYQLSKKRYNTIKTDTTYQFQSINNFSNKIDNYPKCIQKALQLIDVKYTKQITLEDISSEIGVSKYYFSRLLKKTTGRSFKQHLNIRRIQAAKRLMLDEAMNVSEACYAAGFNNLSYFIRVFKQYERIRPSDYRRRRFEMEKGLV